MPVKLLVVDDHEVVRTGLVSLLSGSNVKIVAEASSSAEAVKMASKHKPDVILLDIRMPDGDGLDAMEKIKKSAPNASVVVLSTYDNPTYVARAVASGASDYMLKGASRSELLTAINAAADGKSPSSVGELAKVAGSMAKRNTVEIDGGEISLTNRETQVLRHVALGLSNKEIAHALDISIETVKEHVQNILRKIAVTDRTQAAVWAVKKGLV
jgi:DNA-binding NarL/FixJ family response regulator